jgi:hypothetical protein
MLNQIHVMGAYGRQYATIEAAQKDWNAGKDFKIYSGPYCSKRDFHVLDTVYVILSTGKMSQL